MPSRNNSRVARAPQSFWLDDILSAHEKMLTKGMEDIKSGKINCIIVKDLSRLGRNYIEMGKYLEQIFPMMGIRFIAINDNYDNTVKALQTG